MAGNPGAVFSGADRIRRVLGATMVVAIEKLMGLALTATSVAMALAGLQRHFFKARSLTAGRP